MIEPHFHQSIAVLETCWLRVFVWLNKAICLWIQLELSLTFKLQTKTKSHDKGHGLQNKHSYFLSVFTSLYLTTVYCYFSHYIIHIVYTVSLSINDYADWDDGDIKTKPLRRGMLMISKWS